MFESLLLALAFEFPALTSLYWFGLIVGGGLILISTVFGSSSGADIDVDLDVGGDLDFGGDVDVAVDVEADFDVEADLDVGGDVDADVSVGATGAGMHVDHAAALSLASWFSIRFVVYFMAVFGFVGLVLTYTTTLDTRVAALISLGSGLMVGQGVHQLIRFLQRTSGNSALRPEDYVNKIARVTIGIVPPRTGEIAVPVVRGERYIPALAKRGDVTFKAGEQVAVVAYRGGVAEVISRQEYEFLRDKHEGGSL